MRLNYRLEKSFLSAHFVFLYLDLAYEPVGDLHTYPL